ncbi:MAG: YihY/virulence factor BrkB family protein [Candidatus Nanopelagicales bacterium]|nr:YihY/virulence factor BrkB family protein [Candidatus Nanopelagicales bacterium]MDZ4248631.1 YihY/virulence factor BrkB family protein [Candidatus Nanopelagicales bacterium]
MSVTTLPPIPGESIDPPPKSVVRTLSVVEDRSRTAGVVYRGLLRYSLSGASLLAAGTAYYLFLAVFALTALAFGLTALIGSDQAAKFIEEALRQEFPGVLGVGGIDAEQLRKVGQTTSILGLVALAYASGGAMVAVSASLHQIYGAAKDGRNMVLARVRLVGWSLLIAPLIAISLVLSVAIMSFAQPVMNAIGFDGAVSRGAVVAFTALVSVALDGIVVYVILGTMGGIRPDRQPRLIGAAVGGAGIAVLQYVMDGVVAYSVSKPQYGAFAAPVAVLLVLYLQSVILYGSAALTAGIAEKDQPLVALPPSSLENQ